MCSLVTSFIQSLESTMHPRWLLFCRLKSSSGGTNSLGAKLRSVGRTEAGIWGPWSARVP